MIGGVDSGSLSSPKESKSFLQKYHIPLSIGTIGAMGVLSVGSVNGAYGRKENIVESFHYKGEPAAIIHEEVKFGPDHYFIRLGANEEIRAGVIISDEFTRIMIYSGASGFKIEKFVHRNRRDSQKRANIESKVRQG